METQTALTCFQALSQETRLQVFRVLVKQGPQGAPAGWIAEALRCPPSTLSFHLRSLSDAQLVKVRKKGRSLFYAAHLGQVQALVTFLTENCCDGLPCADLALFLKPGEPQ